MEDPSLSTIHIDFKDGTAVRYVIREGDLEEARKKAHRKVASLKSCLRKVPDYNTVSRKKVDDFVLDCVLLCIASEKRGNGIFNGTVISDFHFTEGVDLPQFGTA